MVCGLQVQSVLEEILEKLPEPFNMMEIMAKAEEKTPFVVVAFQECERMNILTQEIRRSLKELDLGLKVRTRAVSPSQPILVPCGAVAGSRTPHPLLTLRPNPPPAFLSPKGELTITADMEELANALFYDSIPESWMRYAYPSLLSLGAWYADLLLRIRVSIRGDTRGHWLTGLFLNINLNSLKYLKGPVTPRTRAEV